ncbi:MAG: ABC transporter permease [Burkholderiales bacterium]|nr:ABC transporter permease [Burkholderiales bacterium]
MEAMRNRLSWLFVIVVLSGMAISGFLKELALTESVEIQLTVFAAYFRCALVFVVAVFVVTSVAREFNDKGVELLLALAIPRSVYLLGKLSGFLLLALLPIALFAGLLVFFTSVERSLMWSLTLLCEVWIVSAFALLCVLSFPQVMIALSATMGFYVVSRSISSLLLIANESQSDAWMSQFLVAGLVKVLAIILPHLDRFAASDSLVYALMSGAQIGSLLMQTCLYMVLLISAALFDFHRKNL